MKRQRDLCALVLLAGVCLLAGPFAPGRAGAGELGGTLRLFLGQQQVLDVPVALSQVAIGNPAVVDVKIITQGRQVLVTAMGRGTTDLITWDVDGRQTTTLVNVVLKDVGLIRQEIGVILREVEGLRIRQVGDRLLVDGEVFTTRDMDRINRVAEVYPEVVLLARMSPSVSRLLAEEITRRLWENGYTDVRATGIGEKILLEGTVTHKEEIQEVLTLAEAYFTPCVNLVRQAGRVEDLVAIDIRFVEVSRSLAERIGVRWDDSARFQVTSLEYVTSLIRPRSEQAALGFRGLSDFGANLFLQDTDAFARTLAHPRLVCKSGEKADFMAGGEIPIVIILADRFLVQYKNYGIILGISPVVRPDGKISARVEAESSSLDWANAVSGYPALRKRSVETFVTLERGKALALSGLVNSADAKDVDRVPVLGKFPVIGELFKSRGFSNEDTELVIFLSASLMEPEDETSRGMIRSVEDRYRTGDKLLKPSLFD